MRVVGTASCKKANRCHLIYDSKVVRWFFLNHISPERHTQFLSSGPHVSSHQMAGNHLLAHPSGYFGKLSGAIKVPFAVEFCVDNLPEKVHLV